MAKAASPLLQLIRRVVEDQRVRHLSDHDLLQRFIGDRDEAAFHALLSRHGPMVLDVCRSVLRHEADAEDAFQATFLVFAKKAGSIRKRESAGSWLHGVAYRTARKAQLQSATRRKNEARTPSREASEPDDFTWREVREVLHEELAGLSERYRVPLLVCYLEGLTQDEVAAQGMGGFQLLVSGEPFRARFRESFEKPEPVVPSEVNEYTIDLHWSHHCFRKGHKRSACR